MVRPPRRFQDVCIIGCSCDVVDDVGRTDAGEGALSYICMYWFLHVPVLLVCLRCFPRVVRICILYGWGCYGMPPCAF